jgi:hypothetical protein
MDIIVPHPAPRSNFDTLKQFVLNACLRQACGRVLRARLAILKVQCSRFGANQSGGVDVPTIDHAIEQLAREERRRQRLLRALRDHQVDWLWSLDYQDLPLGKGAICEASVLVRASF